MAAVNPKPSITAACRRYLAEHGVPASFPAAAREIAAKIDRRADSVLRLLRQVASESDGWRHLGDRYEFTILGKTFVLSETTIGSLITRYTAGETAGVLCGSVLESDGVLLGRREMYAVLRHLQTTRASAPIVPHDVAHNPDPVSAAFARQRDQIASQVHRERVRELERVARKGAERDSLLQDLVAALPSLQPPEVRLVDPPPTSGDPVDLVVVLSDFHIGVDTPRKRRALADLVEQITIDTHRLRRPVDRLTICAAGDLGDAANLLASAWSGARATWHRYPGGQIAAFDRGDAWRVLLTHGCAVRADRLGDPRVVRDLVWSNRRPLAAPRPRGVLLVTGHLHAPMISTDAEVWHVRGGTLELPSDYGRRIARLSCATQVVATLGPNGLESTRIHNLGSADDLYVEG